MKPKAHILIVEDEALLYKRMKMALEAAHFSVAAYTSSVAAAQKSIQQQKPDLVLLDIDLQGEATGLDLGRLLHNEYHIPFIYVTDYDDDATFFEGLSTQHEHFMVKTKPHLDADVLVREIYTVLRRNAANRPPEKSNILGLTNYLDLLKESGMDSISQVPVSYSDIYFFTVASLDKRLTTNEKEDVAFIHLRTNYLWFLTQDGKKYLLKSSLRELVGRLPYHFVRINDKYIVNLLPEVLGGRINGSRLSIAGYSLQIKDTYKDEVKKRFQSLYQQ